MGDRIYGFSGSLLKTLRGGQVAIPPPPYIYHAVSSRVRLNAGERAGACEFSRKRWDYQNGQEQVAKQQMGKGKKKRGGLGLQSNGEIFRTEKLEWQKKKGKSKFENIPKKNHGAKTQTRS